MRETTGNKPITREKHVPVLVLDCSGSMGYWVQRSITAWQGALRALNYSDDTVVKLIQFDSRTVMTEHKVEELDKLEMKCRGTTSMSGVVYRLEEVLKNNKEFIINIWVISDGQIDDQARFKQLMTENLADSFNSTHINVVGVRLCAGDSDPDVMAMSAVGLLSDQQFKLEDYNMAGNESNHIGLRTILSGMRTEDEAVTVTTQESSLTLRPGEEQRNSLNLWSGDFFMIKAGTEVMVNGHPTAIEIPS